MGDGTGNKRRSNLENAAIAATVAGASIAVGLGARKLWQWFNREEPPALPQVAPPAPLPPTPAPSPSSNDGVIRPDFSGFRQSRSSRPSSPSPPSAPLSPAPEPEPLVEPWMEAWAAKVAEGMGIKS